MNLYCVKKRKLRLVFVVAAFYLLFFLFHNPQGFFLFGSCFSVCMCILLTLKWLGLRLLCSIYNMSFFFFFCNFGVRKILLKNVIKK